MGLCALALLWPSYGHAQADSNPSSYLGVYAQSNSNVLEATNVYAGITVTQVVENSPAAAAGVEVGDILLSANGVELETPGRLDELVAALTPGGVIVLRLERDGKIQELEARTVERLPTPPPKASAAPYDDAAALRVDRRHLGFEFRSADPERLRALGLSPSSGVEVVRVPEQSPLRGASVAPGDIITEVDGRPIPSSRELAEFLEKLTGRASLELTVWDGEEGQRRIDVPLYKPETKLTRLRIPGLFSLQRGKEKSEYSALLGLFRWTRLANGSRFRLLYWFALETGAPDELIDMGSGT